MQAIILAAGVGSRISSLHSGLPKSYLQLAGETLLQRNVRLLRAAGADEIIIVTGYERDRIMRDHAAPDIRFAFNPFFRTTNVLASFWCGLPYLRDSFFYLHGDTVFDPEVLELLKQEPASCALACEKRVCGEEEMKYIAPGGIVRTISKKIASEEAEGEFTGIARISASHLPALRTAAEHLLAAENFSSFFEHALQHLIDLGQIAPQVVDIGSRPWCEIDFPEDYERARKLFEA